MNYRGSLALLSLIFACTPVPGATDSTAASTDEPGTTAAVTTTGTTAPTTGDTGEPGGLHRCTALCSDPDGAPCLIDGGSTGFSCTAGACRPTGCTSDEICRQRNAGWGDECSDQSMCPSPGDTCVDSEFNGGRCAPLEGDLFKCADLGLVPLSRTPIEGGRPVIVCGDETSTCRDGQCFNPCESDLECPPQLGQPHCDLDTGLCTCSDDDECLASGQTGLVACLAGTCGCRVDGDCANGQNVDTCVDGACGCSSTATCTVPVFDNVVQACQPA